MYDARIIMFESIHLYMQPVCGHRKVRPPRNYDPLSIWLWWLMTWLLTSCERKLKRKVFSCATFCQVHPQVSAVSIIVFSLATIQVLTIQNPLIRNICNTVSKHCKQSCWSEKSGPNPLGYNLFHVRQHLGIQNIKVALKMRFYSQWETNTALEVPRRSHSHRPYLPFS